MSDQAAVAPAPAPVSAPPSREPGNPPAPGDPKPSRFRTDETASLDALKLIRPIKDTPPKDPSTGKFVKQSDPNSGVIPELQSAAPSPAADPSGVETDDGVTEPESPEPSAPVFTPVKVGDRVFTSQKDLDAAFSQRENGQSAADRRVADLEKIVNEMAAKLHPQEEAAPEIPADSIKNPFESSLVDSEDLIKKLYADVDDPEKGPVVALMRVVDQMEKRIQDLAKFIEHQQSIATQPMQQFLSAMNSINTTSEFFQQMAQRPGIEIRSRKDITDLTRIIHKHSLALTPENFDLAYAVLRANEAPRVTEPQPEAARPDNTAAASANAVLNGRGRVPDPRAQPKSRSFREEMDTVALRRGRFNTEG